MARTFGQGESKVTLVLAKYAPGISMEVVVSGKPLKSGRSRSFAYSFDPADEIEEERVLFGDTDKGGTVWQFHAQLIPDDTLEARADRDSSPPALREVETAIAERTESLTISVGRSDPVVLHFTGFGQGLEAMDVCLDDLVRSWGYDPEVQRSLATRPKAKGDMSDWFRGGVYPTMAMRKGLSGSIGYRLAINEKGRVTDCVIQSNYSDPAFSESVCDGFTRNARFEPARNAAGEAVKSYSANRVLFLAS
ncbi:TonB family protein [Erythrobacter vulgaris]|uniref:TonB family protein n=1 Tax=Qipengyuania vulgaris TaxID=291985 RepID=A0A844XQ29_9SPHN|nr:TonB family protein [Qipengyuania vulgaris]MXO48071.1 TonB family protein [Qipengyuania vulgaris]